MIFLFFNNYAFGNIYDRISKKYESSGYSLATIEELKRIDREYIDNELKFFKYGYIGISVKNECYVSGNILFSYNMFSPIIEKDKYSLILDIKDMIYPNHINYIELEPIGLKYWNFNNDYYDNNREFFNTTSDNKLKISMSLNNLEEIYSINKIDLGINGYFLSKDLELENRLLYNKNDLEKEINNCQDKINSKLKEKFTKDLISLIIYIICIILFIFISVKVISRIKQRLNKKDNKVENTSENISTVNISYDNSDKTSLSKAIYNHGKDIVGEIKPTVEEYKQNHSNSKNEIQISSNLNFNIDEDKIYEKIMLEIEDAKKVKSTWARALAQSNGDDKKANSLYINFRFKEIKIEFVNSQK